MAYRTITNLKVNGKWYDADEVIDDLDEKEVKDLLKSEAIVETNDPVTATVDGPIEVESDEDEEDAEEGDQEADDSTGDPV